MVRRIISFTLFLQQQSMKFSHSQLATLHGASSHEDVTDTSSEFLGDVVFLMALEGSDVPDPSWGLMERALDTLVQVCQPRPGITHVELCLSPNARKDDMHFATYLGAKAGWGASFGGHRQFYCGHNAARWRAVPVVCKDASARLRVECAKHVNTDYSLGRYICAVPPLRAFASMFPEDVLTPGHCANVSSKCLKRAMPELDIPHSSNWFGPSSLFLELAGEARRAAAHSYLTDREEGVRANVEESRAIATLLQDSDDELYALEDDACVGALKQLTTRALQQGLDDVALRIVQRQLATALLRFSVVRNSM